jgi:hypothetical protein
MTKCCVAADFCGDSKRLRRPVHHHSQLGHMQFVANILEIAILPREARNEELKRISVTFKHSC